MRKPLSDPCSEICRQSAGGRRADPSECGSSSGNHEDSCAHHKHSCRYFPIFMLEIACQRASVVASIMSCVSWPVYQSAYYGMLSCSESFKMPRTNSEQNTFAMSCQCRQSVCCCTFFTYIILGLCIMHWIPAVCSVTMEYHHSPVVTMFRQSHVPIVHRKRPGFDSVTISTKLCA